MDSKLTKLQTDFFIAWGQLCAPLFYKFAHFVGDTAKNPIKVSYRRGAMIKHALDHIGVPSDALWINKAIARSDLYDPWVMDYCRKSGLQNPFTLVDNGYRGEIPYALKNRSTCAERNICDVCKEKNKKEDKSCKPITSDFETILMVRRDGGYGGYPALLSTDSKNAQFVIPDTQKYGANLIEKIPMSVAEYNGISLLRGFDKPLLQETIDSFNTFLVGLTQGFEFCSTDDKKFKKYLDVMNLANTMIYNRAPFKYEHHGDNKWSVCEWPIDLTPLKNLRDQVEKSMI